MPNLRTEVLEGLANLLDRSRISGLCANCGAPYAGELHMCDPEVAANGMIAASWRYLIEGQSPMKRAASYRVS